MIPSNPVTHLQRPKGMSTLAALTREQVLTALAEARARFAQADADLKGFQFSYPPAAEEFEKWRALRGIWEQRDEELQTARDDLRDFDRGHLTISDEEAQSPN
jgi:hypothetical protein